jgi:hypothetical protein
MLPLSAFVVLVLNLAPTVHHFAPTAAGYFAVAAAADAPAPAPASLRAGGRALAGNTNPLTPPTIPQPAQGSIATKPPTASNNNNNNNNAGNDPSFASLVWGNSNQQTPASTSNATTTVTPATNANNQAPATHANGGGGSDDAKDMIHLMQVNTSSWRDPAGVTFYQAEVRLFICHVRAVM